MKVSDATLAQLERFIRKIAQKLDQIARLKEIVPSLIFMTMRPAL